MKGTYRFAERVVEIDSLYSRVHTLCRDYRWQGAPDFTVRTTREDIESERGRNVHGDAGEPFASQDCSRGYLEELAVYRAIAEHMPYFDTLLFHGSAIAVDGAAYIFAARSGTGKSTHARLWRRLLGERAIMVNDDKPLVRPETHGATVFGTPWDGKHRLSANIAVPLKGICVLERAEANQIRRITVEEAYMPLLKQTYRPMDRAAMGRTLDLLRRLTSRVRLYRMGCNMEIEAAEIAYAAMRE